MVSGALDSFFEKYGDLADRINLCKFHASDAAVKDISDVFGICRARREVMWEAKGWSGSKDLE